MWMRVLSICWRKCSPLSQARGFQQRRQSITHFWLILGSLNSRRHVSLSIHFNSSLKITTWQPSSWKVFLIIIQTWYTRRSFCTTSHHSLSYTTIRSKIRLVYCPQSWRTRTPPTSTLLLTPMMMMIDSKNTQWHIPIFIVQIIDYLNLFLNAKV